MASSEENADIRSALVPALLAGAFQAAIFNPYDRALYVRVKHRRRKFLDWRNFDKPFQGFLNASFYRTTVSGSYFLWQDIMRIVIQKYFPEYFHQNSSPALNSALIGLCAATINAFVLNPLQVVKFRMWNGTAPSLDFWRTSFQLYREGGRQIFFRGCLTTTVRDIVFAISYESFRRLNYGEYFFPSNCIDNGGLSSGSQGVNQYGTAALLSNIFAALIASVLSSPFNFVRSVVYGVVPGASPMSALSLHRALFIQAKHMYWYGESYVRLASMNAFDRSLLMKSSPHRRHHLRNAWSWFNSRLNVGWGSLRIALGMGISQNLFYFFQSSLHQCS